MLTYTYKLVTKDNRLEQGEARHLFKSGVRRALEQDGATVLFISLSKSSFLNMEIPFLSSNFPALERVAFFRNFSMMIDAGLPIVLALKTLENQVRGRKIKKTISAIAHDVENGRRLSDAMKKHGAYFPSAITETINVGELSGTLSGILERIAHDLEKNYELRKKVVGAVTYPAVVIFVMLVVLVGLVVIVLPKVAELFDDLDADLPALTAFLLNMSVFLRTHPFIVLGAILLSLGAFAFIYKNKRGHYFISALSLRLPIVGILVREYNLALFFRSMHSLIGSGISLVQAAEVSQKTLRNDAYRAALGTVHPLLLHGVPLSDALLPYPKLFPEQCQRIVMVGESTGRFYETFERIAHHYERSVNYRADMMTTLLEPILMIVVGFMVGALALSIFLPIYQVASVI